MGRPSRPLGHDASKGTPVSAATVVTLGVDAHKDLHVAAVLDQLGRRLSGASVPTDDTHHQVLWD
jgi:hypothetical protein